MGHGKNMALKGGQKKKILGLKGVGGWGQQKNPSNFTVKAFVIMQTAYQNAKTSISDIQKFQIIQRKHAPGPPYQKGNSIPLKCKKV